MTDSIQFTPDGLLPAQDVALTFDELQASPLVRGTGGSPTWDANWRLKLVDNLEVMVRQLWSVGVTEVFVDGSLAEDKDHPNDIDGYFLCDLKYFASGQLERDPNLLDPHKVRTWTPASCRPHRGDPKRQLPMWHVYGVELHPHCGQFSGIVDAFGNELEFPSAFRLSRCDSKPRGIVKLLPGGAP
ncbi:DUF6932 family protein [Myxococcota bacterium]